MPAQSSRTTWTDERLDDFREDVSGRFDSVDRRFDSVDRRLDRIDGRIDDINRTLLVVGGGIAGSILVSAAGIVATQL